MSSPSSPWRLVSVLVPQAAKEDLHRERKCVDVREGLVHCVKARIGPHCVWHNEIRPDGTASIAVNRQTPDDNEAVYAATERPFHLISYSSGADTRYWGRYVCVGGREQGRFDLRYVDEGEKPKFAEASKRPMRSLLEQKYAARFEELGYAATYEPATFRLNTCEYTPDFYLPPPIHRWVEIKGPPPVEEELGKCAELAALGFPVLLLFDDPSAMRDEHAYSWEPGDAEARRGLPTGCEALRVPDDGTPRLW